MALAAQAFDLYHCALLLDAKLHLCPLHVVCELIGASVGRKLHVTAAVVIFIRLCSFSLISVWCDCGQFDLLATDDSNWWAMQWVRHLFTSIVLQKSGFNLRIDHVRLMMHKWAPLSLSFHSHSLLIYLRITDTV